MDVLGLRDADGADPANAGPWVAVALHPAGLVMEQGAVHAGARHGLWGDALQVGQDLAATQA
jgi:hypothetical protein